MKKIAILQSNYIPWKGYFDLISAVDEFVIFDEMQFTKRDWRNRNQIKTPNGMKWLTVPVRTKGSFNQKIIDTQIDGDEWVENHIKSLEHNYSGAKFFNEILTIIKPIYLEKKFNYISDLNLEFIKAICNYLEIDTKILNSSDLGVLNNGKTDRLIDICKKLKGKIYVSGIAAKNYIEIDKFNKEKIKVEWFDYDGFIEYPQLWGEFSHNVTILDLLFNCGKKSKHYLRHL